MAAKRGVERLVRADLLTSGAYTPIRPGEILSEMSGVAESEIVKLDGNENPYGPSPRVRRALADYANYHIYPDPEQQELRAALQRHLGVGAERIIAGAGSDELIDLVLRLLVDPGDEVLNFPPTFGMYCFSTEVCAGRVVSVPRREDFSLDIRAIRKAVSQRTKALFVASPNNPSGNLTPDTEITELLDLGALVVVDEAYHEFSGCTVLPLAAKHDNLVVLRTFSKWAGLAGLRVGYGVFPPALMPHLMRIKQPYNVNVAAQVAAMESLADVGHLMETVKSIVHERSRLFRRLGEFDFIKAYPTQANFILCRVAGGKARHIHRELQRRRIFVRYFDSPMLQDCIRISVGKPEHTDAVIEALAAIQEEDQEQAVEPKF